MSQIQLRYQKQREQGSCLIAVILTVCSLLWCVLWIVFHCVALFAQPLDLNTAPDVCAQHHHLWLRGFVRLRHLWGRAPTFYQTLAWLARTNNYHTPRNMDLGQAWREWQALLRAVGAEPGHDKFAGFADGYEVSDRDNNNNNNNNNNR